jgi:hypothetical protein
VVGGLSPLGIRVVGNPRQTVIKVDATVVDQAADQPH